MTGPVIDADMRALMEETKRDLAAGKLQPDPIPWDWKDETDPEFGGLRRPNEQTPDYLGRVLAWGGFPDLAANARRGHYDDFHAPAEVADGFELVRLVAQLRRAARTATDANGNRYSDVSRRLRRERAAMIENAARRGEFDATKSEGDRWAASKDGQDAFGELASSAARAGRKPGRNEPCWCGSGEKFKRCHGR